MDSESSINQDSIIDPGQNFNYLLKVALGKIKDLASATWTDYNEHDPGITILEQLAYALTELGSKASLPIEDLICKENGAIDGSENLLFTAAEILTSSPVTLDDYRKLLLDTFQEIKNVWIEIDAKGCYQVIVALKTDFIQVKKSKLEDEIISCLNKNRNLGAQFKDIFTVTPCKIGIECSIQVADYVEIRSVIETIMISLNQLITPVVPSGTIQELLFDNQATENIFSGPRMQYGYIMTEDLCAKKRVIRQNEILRIIMSATGVESVSSLRLIKTSLQSANISSENITMESTELAILDIDYSLNHFKLFVGKLQVFPPVRQMISDYYTQKHKNKTPFLTPVTQNMLDLPIPPGTCFNIKEYYSIKNHFPSIYGLDKQYQASTQTPQRQSEVLQLKAYLSFFEQHIANSLTQLTESSTLLGMRSGSSAYYVQTILNYTGMKEILPPDYLQKLGLAMNQPERVHQRLNNVKNHVFARFAEVVVPYQNSGQSGEFDKVQADRDFSLIHSLPQYSSGKAKAPQYVHEAGCSVQKERNGLELKVEILLGLKTTDLKSKSVFLVEHFLLKNNSLSKNLKDEFYTYRLSYIIFVDNINFQIASYHNYVVETISRSCPAHLLCNIILLDAECSETAGTFRKLFSEWIKHSGHSVFNEKEEDMNFQLATFISRNSHS